MSWGWDSASFSHNAWKELAHSDKPWEGKPALTGLQMQTSVNAMPVPIVWGQGKCAPNIIWQNGFTSQRDETGSKGGGEFAGEGTGQYLYFVSVILGVCEGPINDINNVWRDLYSKTSGNTFTSVNGGVELEGDYAQVPWAFVTTNYPTEALAYRGLAYLGLPNYALGNQPEIPQHNFEINGVLYMTGVGGTVPDADPALMVQDFLTNVNYGTPFNPACLDLDSLLSTPAAPTTGDSTMQTYCQAMGFSLSPVLQDAQAASDTLQRWLTLTNMEVVWSGDKLRFVSYGDETVVGNGVTFLPDLTPAFEFTDADYQYNEGEDPVVYERGDPADAKNSFYVEIMNRADDYNLKPMAARDQASIEQYGLLQADTIKGHDIKHMSHGDAIAHLMLQRSAYVRNTYTFKLSQKYIRAEAMDIALLTEARLGLDRYPVRIIEVTETEESVLEVRAEDFPAGVGTTGVYATQPNLAVLFNRAAPPGDTEPPVLFEPPAALNNNTPSIWMAATGLAEFWGGCQVWVSTDNTTYTQIGTINDRVRMGTLTATLPAYGGGNPDTVNTAAVDLTDAQGTMDSTNALNAQAGLTLSWTDDEVFSYEVATLTSPYNYNLTNLYRGLYGTTGSTHPINSPFVRLDSNVFKYTLPKDYIGELLYFKFASFNIYGNEAQSLSGLTPVTYTPSGAAWEIAPPDNLNGTGGTGGNQMQWDASPSTFIDGYNVYAVNDHTSPFGSATIVGSVGPGTTSFFHAGLPPADDWRYWVTAYNAVNESNPDGPIDLTTGAGGGGGSLDVYEDGVSVVASATQLNFKGSGVDVSAPGAGVADINILSASWLKPPTVPTIASTGVSLIQGTAGNGALVDTSRGMYLDLLNAGNTDRIAVASHAVPNGSGNPFVLTALLHPNMTNGTFRSWGLFASDGTKYEPFSVGMLTNGAGWARRVMRYTNISTYSASPGDLAGGLDGITHPLWLRLSLSASFLTMSYSTDGEHWVQCFTEAKATWLSTITACGIWLAYNDNSGQGTTGTTREGVHILSWNLV